MTEFTSEYILELEKKSKFIRRQVIKIIANAGSGHTGGSLSCVDILVALYFHVMRQSPNNQNDNRDRFILSKGHAAPALYATLAEKGYFSEDKLKSLRKNDGFLQGHPDYRIPGIARTFNCEWSFTCCKT